MTAPGRAFRSVDEYAAWCYLYCPWVAWRPTLGEAADTLREHLRTEHADLWVECEDCEGSGIYENFTDFGQPYELLACPDCHGRGYIERNAS